MLAAEVPVAATADAVAPTGELHADEVSGAKAPATQLCVCAMVMGVDLIKHGHGVSAFNIDLGIGIGLMGG